MHEQYCYNLLDAVFSSLYLEREEKREGRRRQTVKQCSTIHGAPMSVVYGAPMWYQEWNLESHAPQGIALPTELSLDPGKN